MKMGLSSTPSLIPSSSSSVSSSRRKLEGVGGLVASVDFTALLELEVAGVTVLG